MNPVPAIPACIDAILSFAEGIAAEAVVDRLQRLEAGPSGVDPVDWKRLWQPLLQEVFRGEPESGGSGISVLRLLQVAETAGLDREEAKAAAGVMASISHVQQDWSRWTEVSEREELRRRLEVLANSTCLAPDLIPFVIFYFRSSDPLLYQAAAVAVGMHLGSSNTLLHEFQDYARFRGIDLGRPIELNGQRNRRRCLVALSAAAVSARPAPVESLGMPGRPFCLDGWRSVRQQAADLSTFLLGAGLLARGRKDPHRDRLLDEMLEELSADESAVLDRIAIQRWGRLLCWRARVDPRLKEEWYVRVWSQLFRRLSARVQGVQAESFSRHFQLLHQVDEVLRTAVFLPGRIRDRLIGETIGGLQGDWGDFCKMRLSVWRQRDEPTYTLNLDPDALSPEPFSFELAVYRNWLVETARPSVGWMADTPREAAEVRLLENLLPALDSLTRWQSCAPRQRVLISFFLLDTAQYSALPESRWRALLGSCSWSTERQPAAAKLANPDGSAPVASTVSCLLRILSLEDTGNESFLDSRVLHQLHDERLILALLPENRSTELLPIVADVLEHQMRRRLMVDPEFSVVAFLYRLLVRRPHVALLQNLQSVCADRSYRNHLGEEMPVAALLEWLIQEKKGLHPELPSSQGLPDVDRSFLEEIGELRSTTPADEKRASALEGLGPLLLWIFGQADSGRAEQGGVFGLIDRLNHGQPACRSGYPAFEVAERGALQEELRERGSRFSQAGARLEMETLEHVAQRREVVFGMRKELLDLVERLLPFLPEPEERAICLRVEVAARLLSEWMAAAESVHLEWRRASPRNGVEAEEGWEQLLTCLSAIPQIELRSEFGRVLWNSMRMACRSGCEFWHEEPWEREFRLWQWACRGTGSRWPGGASGNPVVEWRRQCWRDLADEAMEGGNEARVSRLLRLADSGDRKEGWLQGSFADGLRSWLFSRYRLRDAANAVRLGGAKTAIRVPLGFFLHFSPMWVALVIGAILMLDFGDAWTTMAEIEDTRGILLTFLLASAGTYVYLVTDLRGKVRRMPPESLPSHWISVLGRTGGFLLLCLCFAFAITGFLWFLLSGTDEVVHGEGAILHVTVWSSFALFIGVFFGMIAKQGA